MVVTAFLVENKANQVRFFENTFLVANVSPEIVFGMPFLILCDADVDFLGRERRWKTYTTEEVFLTTKRVKLVDKKEFVTAALDPEHETYVVHVASFSSTSLASFNIYPSQRPQISGLITEDATKISAEYSDFVDIFSPDVAFELPEYTRINNHAIELVKSQQPPYGLIYSLGPVELEILKAYIETNFANGFIRPPSLPPVLPSYLTKSQMTLSDCISTTKASTTSESRTGTCCYWLGSR